MKSLDEMTPEELGMLFPIIISEPDPEWVNIYREEESEIRKTLGDLQIVRLEHIGSTAVPGLKAKPTIDILLEVPAPAITDFLVNKLKELLYHYIPKPENPAPHMMFVKGYSTEGFKGQAFHIHVRYPGDQEELRFRDYLKSHPKEAMEYEALKLRLAKAYPNDREAYTSGKSGFISNPLFYFPGKVIPAAMPASEPEW